MRISDWSSDVCSSDLGMPRRIPDYPEAFAGWNMVSSIGSYIAGAGTLLFLYVVVRTLRSGTRAGENPWGKGATSLEWSLSSPPPFHTFQDLPRIRSELAGVVAGTGLDHSRPGTAAGELSRVGGGLGRASCRERGVQYG